MIDRINISRSANLAAARLTRRMVPQGSRRSFVWLDSGLALPRVFPHRALIKGDERMPIIAAASIIAKVTRDRLMTRMNERFPQYGFHVHKGYGTKLHKMRIRGHGLSEIHRKTFVG